MPQHVDGPCELSSDISHMELTVLGCLALISRSGHSPERYARASNTINQVYDRCRTGEMHVHPCVRVYHTFARRPQGCSALPCSRFTMADQLLERPGQCNGRIRDQSSSITAQTAPESLSLGMRPSSVPFPTLKAIRRLSKRKDIVKVSPGPRRLETRVCPGCGNSRGRPNYSS